MHRALPFRPKCGTGEKQDSRCPSASGCAKKAPPSSGSGPGRERCTKKCSHRRGAPGRDMILFARSARQKLMRRLRELHDRYYDAPSTEVATVAEYLQTLADLRQHESPAYPRGPRLHVGSGEHRIGGWINADLTLSGAQDVLLD